MPPIVTNLLAIRGLASVYDCLKAIVTKLGIEFSWVRMLDSFLTAIVRRSHDLQVRR